MSRRLRSPNRHAAFRGCPPGCCSLWTQGWRSRSYSLNGPRSGVARDDPPTKLRSRTLRRWDGTFSAVARVILIAALTLTKASSVEAEEWRRASADPDDPAAADVPACPAICTVEVEVRTDATTIRIPRRTSAVVKALLVLRGALALAILLQNDFWRGASAW